MITPPAIQPNRCPYLARAHPAGIVEAAGNAICLAREPSLTVAAQHLVVFCLAARYSECSRYHPVVAAPAQTGHGRRHGLLSGLAVLGSVAVGTVISVAIIGNPLAVEPDVQGSSTSVAGTVASTPLAGSGTAQAPVVPIAAVAETPGPSTPSPAPRVISPTAAAAATPVTMVYTVQAGDTAAGIAARFHVSIAALAAANNLASVDRLLAGQSLRIPPAQTATPTTR